MKLHPGRSIKTNLANVEKAQLKLAAKIDGLNDQAKDLLELRTRLEQLLPEAERPEKPQVFLIKVPVPGYETTTGYEETGDDPNAPQATNAEQTSGAAAPRQPAELIILTDKLARGEDLEKLRTEVESLLAKTRKVDYVALLDAAAQSVGTVDKPITEQDIRDVVEGFKSEPGLQMPPVLVVPLVDLAAAPSRKPGWPRGLSRSLTVCKAWPQRPAHRHRTEGDDVYCVEPLQERVGQAQQGT